MVVMNNEEKLSYLVERISRKKEVEAIYLFGSRATGRVRSDSDYDLAVLTKKISRNKELGIIALGNNLFDISIFWRLPLVIQFRVLKEGKLLFSRNEQSIMQAKRNVVKKYLDFIPLLIKSYNEKLNDLRQN